MHAFIISDVSDIPHPVNPFDTLEISSETTIGIDEIRHIKTFLSRKPTSGDFNTVIVHSAQNLTLPAQQAFLKTLEEPPANSRIYLVTSSPDQLLPTILSRVQILSPASAPVPTGSDLASAAERLKSWLESSVGERLLYIDTHPITRQSSLELLDHLEHVLHQDIFSNIYHLKSSIYHLINDTRKYLNANVNPKLALSHFLLNL